MIFVFIVTPSVAFDNLYQFYFSCRFKIIKIDILHVQQTFVKLCIKVDFNVFGFIKIMIKKHKKIKSELNKKQN